MGMGTGMVDRKWEGNGFSGVVREGMGRSSRI